MGDVNFKRKFRPPERNPIDPLPGRWQDYKGYQKTINSNNGEIDQQKLDEHIDMIMNDPNFDWEEIPIDFSQLKKGDRIRYTIINPDKKHLFRTGGWVIAIDDDYKWLVYRAHTQTNWTLQADDCQRLFVTRKILKKKKEKEIIHKFNIPGPELQFNSYLVDIYGIVQRVGSFKHLYEKKKFENRIKFQKAMQGEKWEFR